MTKGLEAVVRLDERVRTLRMAARKLLAAAADIAPATLEGLSDREVEILALVAAGTPNKEIAEGLFIVEDTVKTHLKNTFRKLGARDRAHAVALAYGCGAMQVGDVEGVS